MFELDRHIEILLLKHSCVIVPGFGGFMAHHVSARFDESDETMLPPMRTVGFNPQLTLNDSLLVQSYIEAYDISYPEALRMVEHEVSEMRMRLEQDHQFEITSVGRLYYNEYGQYEFEPFTSGILTPSYYGLSGVDFVRFDKPQAELSPIVVVSTDEEEPVVVVSDANDSSGEAIVTPFTDDESPSAIERIPGNVAVPWGNLVAACLLLLIAFVTPFAIKSNVMHELSISGFNTELFSRFIPKELKEIDARESKVQPLATPSPAVSVKTAEQVAVQHTPEAVVEEPSTDVAPEEKKSEAPAIVKVEPKEEKTETAKEAPKAESKVAEKHDAAKSETKTQKKQDEEPAPTPVAKKNPTYTIVLACSANISNADSYVRDLHNRGYIAARTLVSGRQVRVVHGRYASYIDASQMRENLQSLPEFEQCWILEIPQ